MRKMIEEKKVKFERAAEDLLHQFLLIQRNIEFFFTNDGCDEYNANIGTIYKGSIKESNKKLRFKERFKRQHILAYAYAIKSMGRSI